MSAPTTQRSPRDLRTLSRGAGGAADGRAEAPLRDAAPPAVPRPKFPWKTRVLVPGAILLALLLLIGYTAQDALWPARAVHVVPVVLRPAAPAVAAPVADPSGNAAAASIPNAAAAPVPAPPAIASGATVQAAGWVEADPYAIGVTALAGGVVKEVLALEGQPIKKGDVVARLIDDDARLALARAEADLAQRQAALDAAQRQWDHPVERTRAIASGQAMVAETKAMIEKHHAEQRVEEAKLAAAREEFQRIEQSVRERASSEIELIRARQGLAAQEATLKAIIEQENVLNAQLAQRQAELVASTENLRLRIEEKRMLDEARANLALATAMRDEAALRLSRMEVRSPADGIVMQRLAEPGAKLLLEMDDPKSAQAVRLYDPKKLQVRVDVPLVDAAKVGVGQPAQIVVGVLPDRAFSGKVTRVVNEADIQKNTLQVKVAIDNPTPELKPEMLARVKFSAMAAAMAAAAPGGAGNAATPPSPGSGGGGGGGMVVYAPESLLHRHAGGGGDEAEIWVVNARTSTASHRSVHLGAGRHEGWIEILQGLAAGDQLIIETEGLTDGQKVRIVGEGEPPPAGAAGAAGKGNAAGGQHGAH
ncbi:MAG TPA: efflux RND transporter periplasmic adaptor subunit [Tepidisphaeraceae bacterium]|nr:efflux RND transporter periplasmic adaptor subunit [Tepidisphaeraceae bacterium]